MAIVWYEPCLWKWQLAENITDGVIHRLPNKSDAHYQADCYAQWKISRPTNLFKIMRREDGCLGGPGQLLMESFSGKSRTRSLTGNKSAVSQGRERRIVSLKSRASFLFHGVQCWSQGERTKKKSNQKRSGKSSSSGAGKVSTTVVSFLALICIVKSVAEQPTSFPLTFRLPFF